VRISLDAFRPSRVGSRLDWGVPIPDDAGSHYDFERLERAVNALVVRYEELRAENSELRRTLRERDQHVRGLDATIRESNQRRQDVGKHIDDLIAQIDQLDARFEAQEEL
jgi:septal ring factor EnvC (AmiA/AmiB activator)